MNVKICDICRYEENKLSHCDYKISAKNAHGTARVALDVCSRHKNAFKDLKGGFEKARQFCDDLFMTGKQLRIDLLFKDGAK